jgi:hypothetical protein
MSNKVVALQRGSEALSELWSPRVVGELDEACIKVDRLQGSLDWLSHDKEDELFFVLRGHLLGQIPPAGRPAATAGVSASPPTDV